jgi:hypothetical protein
VAFAVRSFRIISLEHGALCFPFMNTQMIECVFDKDSVWERVNNRLSVFLDTMCWIEMADEVDETACRVRDRLRELVAAGRVFCPVSWGTLEELFKQSGDSLHRMASLMEELSLNACFVMRTELYAWELARSVRRLLGGEADESLKGLFAPPAVFCGSGPQIVFPRDTQITPAQKANAEALMKHELSSIGIRELADKMGGSRLDETPAAYSTAARSVQERLKGNKKKLFLEEAGNCMYLYITPMLKKQYPSSVMIAWLAQFNSGDNKEAWFQKALAELPALFNFIDVMMVADLQPSQKDEYNDFMDHEIMVAPLAYANVFVSKDRNVRDVLRNRTKILSRSKCQYCDSLGTLETWLTENAA